LTRLLARPPCRSYRDYSVRGGILEIRQPLLLGKTSSARSDRRVDAAHPSGPRPLASAGGGDGVRGACRVGLCLLLFAQLLLRSDSRDPRWTHAAGRGEVGVRLDLTSRTSSASSVRFSIRSARRSPPIGRRWPVRSPTRVRGPASRGCRRHHQSAGRAALRQPRDASAATERVGRRSIDDLIASDHPLAPPVRADAPQRRVAPDLLSAPFLPPATCRRRFGGRRPDPVRNICDVARDQTINGRAGRHHDGRAQLEYLSQVQSTIRYSRKLAARGSCRRCGGRSQESTDADDDSLSCCGSSLQPAHRSGVSGRPRLDGHGPRRGAGARRRRRVRRAAACERLANEIRRLDEVVQGSSNLRGRGPQASAGAPRRTARRGGTLVKPEAERAGIQILIECDNVRDVNGDRRCCGRHS